MKITDSIIVSFDLETTGTDVETARIVQIGVASRYKHLEHARWCACVNPHEKIPKQASEVHGITDEHVAGADDFAVVADAFLNAMERDRGDGSLQVITGYNILHYDLPLVAAEFHRLTPTDHLYGRLPVWGPDRAEGWQYVIDPVVWLRWFKRAMHARKLSDACRHYNIETGVAHTADADALSALQLLLAMVEEGIIPDDVELACRLQAQMVSLLDAERERFAHYLYATRTLPATTPAGAGVDDWAKYVPKLLLKQLYMGFDKRYVGRRLEDVPADFWTWLSGLPDQPPAAVMAAVVKSLQVRSLAVPPAWAAPAGATP